MMVCNFKGILEERPIKMAFRATEKENFSNRDLYR
jgi:hypothetical protein